MAVVIESFDGLSAKALRRLAAQGVPVYVLEPFVAYHYRQGEIPAFPGRQPDYVARLAAEGAVQVVPATDLDPKTLYVEAADRAVAAVEAVFPAFREAHRAFCRYVRRTLQTDVAEWVYRKYLVGKLAEFYSINLLLARIEKRIDGPIEFHPQGDVRGYVHMRRLLARTGQPFHEHPRVRFAPRAMRAARLRNFGRSLMMTAKVGLQVLGSAVLWWRKVMPETAGKDFRYAITVVSPARQLSDNRRGVDFLVDGQWLKRDEIVLLSQVPLTAPQRQKLQALPYACCDLNAARHVFSHFGDWARLLATALGSGFLRNADDIAMATSVCFNCFRWEEVLRHVRFRHLVTHCDFGLGHLGRNIALKAAGVETWYFSDAMNFGWRLVEERESWRFPSWCYLYYDHLVTWDQQLADFFLSHPCSFRQAHVVGCLWAGHVTDRRETRRRARRSGLRDLGDRFMVAVFDTTYSLNGAASYDEAMAFAADILRLAEEVPDIAVILKEKKARSIHEALDPVRGPKLVEFYQRMDHHPRITVCTDEQDAAELVSAADVVVSFPFTSTTFEALAAGRPALWHDPLGLYRHAAYAKVPGVTTRGYEELKARILEIMAAGSGSFKNPFPAGSPLMDPYRDDQAIERFRQLLASADPGRPAEAAGAGTSTH